MFSTFFRYPEKVLNQLIVRYEKPDAKNRWDTPLFSVHVGNAEMLVSGDRHEDLFSSDLDFDDFTSSNQEEGNNSTPPSTQSPEELKLPRNVDLPLEEIYMALVKVVFSFPNVWDNVTKTRQKELFLKNVL